MFYEDAHTVDEPTVSRTLYGRPTVCIPDIRLNSIFDEDLTDIRVAT